MARLLANPASSPSSHHQSIPPQPPFDSSGSNGEGYIEQLDRWYPPTAPSDHREPPSQQRLSLLHRRRRSGLESARHQSSSSSRPSSIGGSTLHQGITRPRTATAEQTTETTSSPLFGRRGSTPSPSPSPFRRWAPGRITARSPTPHTSREPIAAVAQIRVAFPDHRTSLRNPFDSSVEDLEYSDYTTGTGRRPSSLLMNQVTRTTSSSSNAGGGNGGGGGGAFSRMLRRYSQGQGRTLSNATDASAQLARSTMDRNRERSNTALSYSETSRPGTAPSTPGLEIPPTAIGASGLGASPSEAALPTSSASSAVAAPVGTNPSSQAGVHRIRLVPHLEATRSLHFEPIERDVREGAVGVKIGRFTDRGSSTAAEEATAGLTSSTSQQALGAAPGNRGGAVPSSAGGGGRVDSARIAFKSKVVSRGHAEVWCEGGGKFFIKDTKSSSGTFLNHIRLSPPNVESRPYSIKDGDILQLGVDYQGGTEEIYRCVKIRVELNRGWQREANQFNVNALRQLRALQGSPLPAASAKSSSEGAGLAVGSSLPTNRQSMNTTDCCICLFSVTVCQALFIAPCSHVYHYKCIRPLLTTHHPGFSCPLCRTFADLEADVEQDEAWQEALMKEAGLDEVRGSTTSNDLATPSTELPPGASMTASNSEVDGYMAAGGGGSRSAPLPSSGLRRLTASSNARPDTAVADEDPASRNSTYDPFDTTAVFHSATSQELQGSRGDDDEEELLDESPYDARNAGGTSSDRTPEEGDRSVPNLSNLQQRRGSQPIAIGGHTNRGADSVPISGFSPLEESRTPVNQHVLSVLAELPPPATAAARRLASVQQANATTGSVAMPSLGSNDNFLSAPNEDVEMDSTGRPSDDGNAGFQTPAGSVDGHQRLPVISSVDRSAAGGLSSINANPGFTNSNRASPTTASGEGQEEELLRDDEEMDDISPTGSTSRPIVTSPNAPPTPSKTNNVAGKDAKSRGTGTPTRQYVAGGNSTNSDYRGLNSSTSRDSGMGRRSQPGSPPSTGSSGGGKMRSFFKKATGGSSGSGGTSGWGTGSGSGADAGGGSGVN